MLWRTDAHHHSRAVPIAQNCGKWCRAGQIGRFRQPRLGGISHGAVGNIRQSRRVDASTDAKEFERMMGKLFGAWLGDKIAGPNSGAKGAILGYGTAALAKRS